MNKKPDVRMRIRPESSVMASLVEEFAGVKDALS